MTLYVLTFLFWNKAGLHFLPGFFPDKFNCQVAEGEIATMLQADKTVTGWYVLDACPAVKQTGKV